MILLGGVTTWQWKWKQNIKKNLTMHDLACLLSKRYLSETFAMFIKNKDNIINLCLSGSITIFCNKIFFVITRKQATASQGPKCMGIWNYIIHPRLDESNRICPGLPNDLYRNIRLRFLKTLTVAHEWKLTLTNISMEVTLHTNSYWNKRGCP